MARQLRVWAALIGSGAILGVAASPAGASVTIGQIPAVTPTTNMCATQFDLVQPTVTSGNSYVVPSTGDVTSWTVTSWSHFAMTGSGQMLTMKIFRKVADPNIYKVVAHDGPHPLAPAVKNTFPTSIAVSAGDVLGSNSANAATFFNACIFDALGDAYRPRMGDLADGEGADFTNAIGGRRVNISAEVTPTNTFTIGATARNKKKGTATITANLPNPGDLTASGNGVRGASAGPAVISKSVGAGPAALLIKAKGKKKRKLNQSGKVKLNVAVTYTPTGGDPKTQSLKVKLKKSL